ncbi:MAG TPA: ATP-grasp domain-containing protein [Rhizomicrobium sp.]|nr:ATP-grasp domain-containing protein [Rhizomicrobium sp.]
MANRILLAATIGWPTAARYASGFVTAGCSVDSLAPKQAPVRASRYVTRNFNYNALFPIAALRAAISQSKPDLIMACDDRAVTQLLELHRREKASSPVARLIERSLGRVSDYPLVLSRQGSLEAMRAEGVRVPDSIAIENPDALPAAIERIGLPAVLKADGSWGGEGVAIVRSREEARAAFCRLAYPPPRWRSLARAVRRRDAHFLHEAIAPMQRTISLQKFIPGHPAASAFAAKDGEIVASLGYDVLVAQGTIGPPNVIRRTDCRQIEEAATKAARRFGLSGLHGLDFIRDANGDVHLIEINPRATQGGTLAYGAGRDLPAGLAATLSAANSGMRPPIENDVVAFFPRAWQRNDAGGYWLARAHHDIPWDDPGLLRTLVDAPAGANDNQLRDIVYAQVNQHP